MKAVITIAIGERYQEMAKLTHPRFSAYSNAIGADFISINTENADFPHLAKYRISEFLNIYDRILYVDTDILINNNCPDIFEIAPKDAFSAWFPNPMIPGRFLDQIALAQAEMGNIGWTNNYFNSGVMVVSRIHTPVFANLHADRWFVRGQSYFDQTLLNYRVQKHGCKIFDLGYSWNHTQVAADKDRFQSHFIHYCGDDGHIPGLDRLDQIRADLDTFR